MYARTKTSPAVHGEAVAGETRVNPDGNARPLQVGRGRKTMARRMRRHQPAALARSARFDADLNRAVDGLLTADLEFTRRHWREPCFDLWEEEKDFTTTTLRLAAAALDAGAGWYEERGESARAEACRSDAGRDPG